MDLRRKRVWARQQGSFTGVGQTGEAQLLDTSFTTAMGTNHMPVGVTIGGILLDFQVERTVAGTALSSSNLQFGVLCTQEPTEAEVPRPLSEPHADWMWWQMVSFSDITVGANSGTWRDAQGPERLRAKRKCEELGEHLWLVFQGWDIAPEFNISYSSSVLMLLP